MKAKRLHKLYDIVKIKRNNLTGTIVDVGVRGGKRIYVVESDSEGERTDADYGGQWPLYDCTDDDITTN